VENLTTKNATKIIKKLLIVDRCNHQVGKLVNNLLDLTWNDDFDFGIIEYYFKNANHYGHFKDISFILSESKFNKDKRAFYIIKKLISLYDIQILQDLLVYYLIQLTTKDDMEIYLDLFKQQNTNIISIAILSLLHLNNEDITKLIELNKSYDIDLSILQQSNNFLIKNIQKQNKKHTIDNMLYLVAMKRNKVQENYIKNFVLDSKDINLYNLYYNGICI